MAIKIASFIKTEFGKSEFFSEELQKIPDITKILSISGEYDLLIEITAEKTENDELTSDLKNLIIDIRKTAKENKNYALSDKIRDELARAKIEIRDSKDGSDWKVK